MKAERNPRLELDERAHHLHQVVLHHVPQDSILVEVAGTPLTPDFLLEDHLDALDMLSVPDGAEAHLMREVISDHWWSSGWFLMAIGGSQRQLVALRGTLRHWRHSEALGGTRWHSVALGGTRWHSVAMSGNEWQ